MRGLAPFALFAPGLLAACDGTPDFDERYQEKQAMITASANKMEQEVTRQMAAAREAANAMGEQALPIPGPMPNTRTAASR